jgi:hypothetical protein
MVHFAAQTTTATDYLQYLHFWVNVVCFACVVLQLIVWPEGVIKVIFRREPHQLILLDSNEE